ncbi:MAG: hypothetical protein ACLQNG_05455 [Acidimicrobiales bacterium]
MLDVAHPRQQVAADLDEGVAEVREKRPLVGGVHEDLVGGDDGFMGADELHVLGDVAGIDDDAPDGGFVDPVRAEGRAPVSMTAVRSLELCTSISNHRSRVRGASFAAIYFLEFDERAVPLP